MRTYNEKLSGKRAPFSITMEIVHRIGALFESRAAR
jgi:hypothetical protein